MKLWFNPTSCPQKEAVSVPQNTRITWTKKKQQYRVFSQVSVLKMTHGASLKSLESEDLTRINVLMIVF